MESTSRWIRVGAALLVLAAAGLRAYMYAAGSSNVPVSSDEALTVLQDYVKEADGLMYEIKQQVHARDGMRTR